MFAPFESPFTWEPDSLVEQCGQRRYIYGRWDRMFGLWIADDTAPPRPFVPNWPLLNTGGRLALGRSDSGAAHIWGDEYDDLDDGWFAYEDCREMQTFWGGCFSIEADGPPPIALTAAAYFERYAGLIPFDIRRMAGAFASWQWVILRMTWESPAFADFLDAELAATGPGFVASCLAMHGAATLSRHACAALARRIMSDKRRNLITGAVAAGQSGAAVMALSRLAPDGLDAGTCERLLRILSDPAKAKVIARARDLTKVTIQVLDHLPAWICTGNLPRLIRELDDPHWVECSLSRLAGRIEQSTPDLKPVLQRAVRDVRSADRLCNLIAAWDTRIAELLDFPSPPYALGAPLQPITSAGAMRAAALRMRNCIANYISRVIRGEIYFYLWEAEEPACVMIKREAAGKWRLAEYLGPGNQRLSEATAVRIRATVNAVIDPRPVAVSATARPIPAAAPRVRQRRVAARARRRRRPTRDERQHELVFA